MRKSSSSRKEVNHLSDPKGKSLTVRDICQCLEEFAPLSFQESWDNCGLLIGSMQQPVPSALLTIDVTEAVVAEAVERQIKMIISHHPLILSGIKQLTGSTDVQRAVAMAVKNDIAVYAAHTNMDTAPGGVSHRMAEKLGLTDVQVLSPQGSSFQKLVTFVPEDHYTRVREAVFQAGAGHIGNYDMCGYGVEGKGTFRAGEHARPFVGQRGKVHIEPEIRFETIFPMHFGKQIIAALTENHPYEEPAYDIYDLKNTDKRVGLGVTGLLSVAMSEEDFLRGLKKTFLTRVVRHTRFRDKKVSKIALCGGSGSSLIREAVRSGADVFVTADFKYHQFADAESDILIADIGHFESEQFTKEIFHEILTKKFPNFAIHFSEVKTNPINYL